MQIDIATGRETARGERSLLGAADHRLMREIQGRTCTNICGLIDRFINQKALETLARFSDEELEHQELFGRVEAMIGRGMPAGYRFLLRPDQVAAAVPDPSAWAVLALVHLWLEDSQRAVLDEVAWRREDAELTHAERDGAVDDLIALVGAVDGLLQVQAGADGEYFLGICAARFDADEIERVRAGVLRAYRRRFLRSGARHPRFGGILASLITAEQGQRVAKALAPLVG